MGDLLQTATGTIMKNKGAANMNDLDHNGSLVTSD